MNEQNCNSSTPGTLTFPNPWTADGESSGVGCLSPSASCCTVGDNLSGRAVPASLLWLSLGSRVSPASVIYDLAGSRHLLAHKASLSLPHTSTFRCSAPSLHSASSYRPQAPRCTAWKCFGRWRGRAGWPLYRAEDRPAGIDPVPRATVAWAGTAGVLGFQGPRSKNNIPPNQGGQQDSSPPRSPPSWDFKASLVW